MTQTIKIIFTVLVLLNITLLGVVGGGYYKMQRQHVTHETPNKEVRDFIKEKMKTSKKGMLNQFKEIRQYHSELKQIVTAPEFDRAAYDEVVTKILEVKNQISHQKAEATGNILADMSQEQRQKMAEGLLKNLSGKRHLKKGSFDRDIRSDRRPMDRP